SDVPIRGRTKPCTQDRLAPRPRRHGLYFAPGTARLWARRLRPCSGDPLRRISLSSQAIDSAVSCAEMVPLDRPRGPACANRAPDRPPGWKECVFGFHRAQLRFRRSLLELRPADLPRRLLAERTLFR